eukprot:jgi/Picre1/32241/NNA_007587.t1
MKLLHKAALSAALVLALFAGGSHAYSAFDLSSEVDFEDLLDLSTTMMQAQTTRGLLQNTNYGAPPVPEEVEQEAEQVDDAVNEIIGQPDPEDPDPQPANDDDVVAAVDQVVDAINQGEVQFENIPNVAATAVDSEISFSSSEQLDETQAKQVTATIATQVANSINIPGTNVQTRTRVNGNVITVQVFLGEALQRLMEYYGRILAARANDMSSPAAGRSLLQTSSRSRTVYVVIGEDKAQVARFQRQLDDTLRNQTAMSEIANQVVEGSTASGEIVTRPPPPPAPAPPLVCSYSGHFTISPLYSPCNRYFMAYVYPNCANTNVYLRTTRQLGNKPRRAVWHLLGGYLDGRTVSTTISAVERRRCSTRYLQDTSGASMLVSSPEKQWTISPAGNGKNCDQVNIFSEAKQAYLQVPRSCNSFSYASSDGGRQRFRLRQV